MRRAVLSAREEWGTTLIIASHHRSWLNDICDRIIYLYNGRILDCSYENILTGPWEEIDDVTVACKLSDGQRVYVAKPPHTESNSVISPEALKINGAHAGKNAKSFQGVITSVTQDNHVTDPQVHVSCGDQRFLVSISSKSLESEKCWPGRQVTLYYNPADITWLKK
jgi:tungstate transport system ATP-binding protein